MCTFSRGEVIGGLLLRSYKPYAYGDEEIRLAERIANQIAGAIANAQLFMKKKQTEEALRQSEERFRQVAENVGDFIWEVDEKGVYRYTSPSVERILGYTPEELVGKKHFYDLFAPEVREELREAALGVFAAREPFRAFPNPNLTKEGRVVYLETSGVPVLDGRGNLVGYRGADTDVTERKKAEEQLHQTQKMEALGTLSGGIAHDFNNLLMPILLNAEMAVLDIKAGVLPSLESMETAIAGAKRGKELVQQIITFSRHKGQKLKPLDIAPIMKETIRFLRSAVPKTIRFETYIEDPSPSVLADPTQIHQVMMNLINNAIDAMQDEEGILEISLQRQDIKGIGGIEPGPYVRLNVKDSGHGMHPGIMQKAFDPFFTTKGPGKGSGLGLAVVHGIVKKHGGEIRLQSEVGKGTTVSIFLPVYEGVKKEEASFSEVGIQAGTGTILFIDDEEVQTRTVGTMLKRLGYNAVIKTDPREALEAFRAQPYTFDLVITDQVMPYATGTRLCQELLAIRPDLPIILCTGYSEQVDEEKVPTFGVKGFIQKPFTMNEISQAIRKAMPEKGS